MNFPSNIKYTKDHEWVKVEGEFARIGITEYAQGELGDIVFVELPKVGSKLEQGKSFGTIGEWRGGGAQQGSTGQPRSCQQRAVRTRMDGESED
ncbi:MAG: gcvH [Bacteroidetes bacterium]|nr:gcvH [Bacteroidota bacterium]